MFDRFGIKENNFSLNQEEKIYNKNNLQTFGTIVSVFDDVIHCIGMPNVKFGEIVYIKVGNKKYNGLVVNIS